MLIFTKPVLPTEFKEDPQRMDSLAFVKLGGAVHPVRKDDWNLCDSYVEFLKSPKKLFHEGIAMRKEL